jgi:GTP-binding protein
MTTPTVAIVGRPNVGKSTLFNRLVGKRQAIVHDLPGVTRDRIVGRAEISGDRAIELIDTGGLAGAEDAHGLSSQVFLAIAESDVLLFVVDGVAGIVFGDQEISERLRRTGKPTILVVNKSDTREARQSFHAFSEMGFPTMVLISAEHGTGIEELRDVLAAVVPEAVETPSFDAPAIAIVGRPNVGKSSLLNRISGQTRALVSPVAGTTRDPVDTLITRGDKSYLLIDTAGIRRRSQTSGAPEELAVMMARRSIERASLAVLVIDATQGVTSGDLAIAGSVWELGRAAILAVNKWDLLDEVSRERLELTIPRLLEILCEPPRVNLSALTGRGVDKLFAPIDHTLAAYRMRLTTGELNRMLEKAIERVNAPAIDGRPWRLYYATQVSTGPPTLMLFANRALGRNHTYRRYLENRLRDQLGLSGVPLRLVVRRREKQR